MKFFKKNIQFVFLICLFSTVLVIDVAGYMLIEKVDLADALHMTVISITTVGFGEVFELSQAGRIFTYFVLFSGLGVFLYFTSLVAETAIEGRIRKILGRRKMKSLANKKNHVIIAGFGRMGKIVASELAEENFNLLIVEKCKEAYSEGESLGYDIIQADATSEEGLKLAAVEKAKTFISLLSSDADNMFTVLTARDLNADVFIITRAQDIINENRLYKSGANRVITPNELTSRRIVNNVLKPNVVDMLEVALFSKELNLAIEEITISDSSSLSNRSLRNSGLRERYDAIVVAVRTVEKMIFNPSPDLVLNPGDILILVGEKEKLDEII